MIGRSLRQYAITGRLGQGGMGEVWPARDSTLEREVALKILKQDLLNDLPLRERFEHETRIIAKLEHVAIVPVYDVGPDYDQLFFVMRYMAGGSLSERIQSGSLSLADVATILQRLAAVAEFYGEPVKQSRVRWRFALGPQVFACRDEPDTEIGLPYAVDERACGSR